MAVYIYMSEAGPPRTGGSNRGPVAQPRTGGSNRGPVAQLVEQRFALREVVSSTLAGPILRVLK